MEDDLVKMSPEGQLVVSQDIRIKEGFKPGDRFVPFAVKGGGVFKKVEMPNVKAEFQKLSKEIEKKFKRNPAIQTESCRVNRWQPDRFQISTRIHHESRQKRKQPQKAPFPGP